MKDSKVVMGNLRKRARRGVSLIEVLVVLVLLVLGILIIVRLFPSGFFSINSVGDAALADGLGQAAVSAQAQNAAELPESILPGSLTTLTAANGDYDPDDPNAPASGYDNARVVTNETITVPAPSGPKRQSIYVVNYGPIVMPVAITDPNVSNYLAVNSNAWAAVAGDSNISLSGQDDLPQTTVFPDQQRFVLDAANSKIALPYASYTAVSPASSTTVGTSVADSYARKVVVAILASDGKTYTQYLNLPAATKRDNTNPYAPFGPDNRTYLPDTTTSYQGGWFDPTTDFGDPSPPLDATGNPYPAHSTVPATGANGKPIFWQSVTLYRPFVLVSDNTQFTNDPYQYTLTSANITDGTNSLANLGSIEFNPKGVGRSGSNALKAQISYQVYSWKILHEDRDIAAISGTDTSVSRLTLKNIKRAGDSGPDNVIYTGLIPGSYQSVIVLDLDDGTPVGNTTGGAPDPTAETGNINDEDLNGTKAATNLINFSFSTGRVTFGSDAFSDNVGGTTPHAHRVRIYYAAEGDWTVAVQKAPSVYKRIADVVVGTDPNILPGQCAFDSNQNVLYFPHSDYGKTVAIDNIVSYDANGAALKAPQSVTIAIGTQTGDQLTTLGGTVKYWSSSALVGLVPSTAKAVTFTVRGLSARAVVAWKERDRWKVHSVDTVLTRAQ